jgi:hypothetical protein
MSAAFPSEAAVRKPQLTWTASRSAACTPLAVSLGENAGARSGNRAVPELEAGRT